MHPRLQNILFRQVYVIQCDQSTDGDWLVRYAEYHLKSGSVEISGSWTDWMKADKLRFTGFSVCVVQFVGKLILEKVGKNRTFPRDLNENSSLTNSVVSVNGTNVEYIVQSDSLNTVLGILTSKAAKIAGVSFGASHAIELCMQLESSDKLVLQEGILDLTSGGFVQGGEESSTYLDTWGNLEAAHFFSLASSNPKQVTLREEISFNLLCRSILKFAVFGLLSVLLFNFFIFQSQHERFQELSSKNQIFLDKQRQLSKLIEDNAKSQSFIESYVPRSTISITQLLDFLGSSLPSDLQLSEVEINPIEIPDRFDQVYKVQNGIVRIVGEGHQGALNSWIRILSQSAIIEEVRIQDFKSTRTGINEFEIEVAY